MSEGLEITAVVEKPKDLVPKRTRGPSKPVAPKLNVKGNTVLWHHLFKGEVASCMKNQSYIYGDPKIEMAEHVHFYHNINSSGRELMYTNSVAGHYHAVKWSMDDKSGEMVATCGPAIQDMPRKPNARNSGKRRGPVKFFDNEKDDFRTDDHKHVMTYKNSEEVNIDDYKRKRSGGK